MRGWFRAIDSELPHCRRIAHTSEAVADAARKVISQYSGAGPTGDRHATPGSSGEANASSGADTENAGAPWPLNRADRAAAAQSTNVAPTVHATMTSASGRFGPAAGGAFLCMTRQRKFSGQHRLFTVGSQAMTREPVPHAR
ncbi:hypothetical protein GCM10009826_00950 [Humibacillus xanthopallidus]